MSRYCTLTLQSTTFSFNATVLRPQNQFRLALHAVCFLPCQSLTKLCDFPYPVSGLIQNSIPNFKPGLALHSQNMQSSYPRKCFWAGCVILKVYFLRGSSKAYSLYKVYITLHFTVPDKKVQLYSL